WDGVGTAAVTLVGPIAYFTRVSPFGLLMDGIFPFAIHYTENRLDCSPQSRLGQLRLSGPDSDHRTHRKASARIMRSAQTIFAHRKFA
ncbi:MAG: hypothetical protein WBV31_00760, partial [Terriglobales bacterium]